MSMSPSSQTERGEPRVREEALGFWAFRPVAGGAACLIALNRLPVEGGFGVHVERCEAKGLSSAARWRADGEEIVIEAGDGAVLARFRMVDANTWTGEDFEGAAWRMEPSPA